MVVEPMNPSRCLAGKRALITGGSRGLGFEVAAQMAQAGARVTIVGRTAASVGQAAARLQADGYACDAIAADLATHNGPTAAADQALALSARWDILVNSAGVALHQPLTQIDRDTWDQTLAVNLTAPFVLCQRIGAAMAEAGSGAIINVSSHSGLRTGAGSASYSVSKSGLQMLTQSLATELGPYGVRANVICPTIFMSEMGQQLWGDPEVLAAKTDVIPAKRLGTIQEIANVVLFLAGPDSTYVNGAVISVDGGLFAGRPRPGLATRTS